MHQLHDEGLNAALYMLVSLQNLAAKLEHACVISVNNGAVVHSLRSIETTDVISSAHCVGDDAPGARCWV